MYLREFIYEIIHGYAPSKHAGVHKDISFQISPNLTQLILESESERYIRLGDLELTALCEAFQIKTDEIHILEWEQVRPGCDTCGDGSWGRLTVQMPGNKDLLLIESGLDTIIEKLRITRAEILAEERREAAVRAAQYAKEREARKEQNRRDNLERELRNKASKLTRKMGLTAFEIYKPQIFDAIIQEYQRYKTLDRKTLAGIIKDSPIRSFLFAIHNNPSQAIACLERSVTRAEDKARLGQWWKDIRPAVIA